MDGLEWTGHGRVRLRASCATPIARTAATATAAADAAESAYLDAHGCPPLARGCDGGHGVSATDARSSL
eukprot:scaffold8531_cov30-Tisochrysis_lutea.AAC.2